MDGVLWLATSYPPGHDFWPGSPASWWIRGSIAFLLLTAPIVIAWILILLMSRHRLSVWRGIVPLLICVLFAFAANDANVRDGDMPVFRGVMWGKRISPWLTTVAVVSLPFAILWQRRSDGRRGFEVVPEKR